MNYLPHFTTFATYLGFGLFGLLTLLLLGSLLPVAGGYQLRVVESGSMEPTFSTGAVIATRAASSYAVGDVVTFQRRSDARATTHRIVSIDDNQYIMQGDANNAPDMVPVAREEIAGKVWFAVPFLGYVLSFIKQPWGFLLIVGVPASLIVYEQVQRIRREMRTMQADKTTQV